MFTALDDIDWKIAHALQVDGRAPFRQIGDVLGVSDQTVARHYASLRSTGRLRVVGLTDPFRTGQTPWMLRVRCTPDAAASIGEALARRHDTRWVTMTTGGTEICTMVHAEADQGEALLLDTLPRTPRVVGIDAYAFLHFFFAQEQNPLTRSGPLTAQQVAELAPADAPNTPQTEPAPPYPLDDGDRRLLAALARDGRAAIGDLATVTTWSQTTVRRRISQLRASGVLYFDVDLASWTRSTSFRVALWCDVEPGRLAEAGAALAEHPEVAFAGATTGPQNVYASVLCQDAPAFYRYLTGAAAALPGVRRIETALLHRTLKGPSPARSSTGQ